MDEEFINKLFDLCLDYDNYSGTYPESYLEGMSLFIHYLEDNYELDKLVQEYISNLYDNKGVHRSSNKKDKILIH